MAITNCPVCGSSDASAVLRLEQVPVSLNSQVGPAEARLASCGDIDLVVCRHCAHLYNAAFDASIAEYDGAYENSLHFSPTFAAFAAELARRLVAEHGLTGADVAELGAGPGHFLRLLCEAGAGRGFGFDPSYRPDRLQAIRDDRVELSSSLFPADGSLRVRMALSQHVLEHLDDPVAALRALRAAVDGVAGGLVYSEVPNGELMIEQCALWDLIYEHVSYFVPTSLQLACTRAGLVPEPCTSTFGDQFLSTTAVPGPVHDAEPDPGEIERRVAASVAFGERARRQIEQAGDELRADAARGPVVLWGAGSKGMTFLNLVARVEPDLVASVIDINPRKAGFAVPGTGHLIAGPEVLSELRPVSVLVANPLYVRETAELISSYGVQPQIRALWG